MQLQHGRVYVRMEIGDVLLCIDQILLLSQPHTPFFNLLETILLFLVTPAAN